MKLVLDKVNRVKQIESELEKIDKFLKTLHERLSQGKALSFQERTLIYGADGNTRAIVPVEHIFAEPESVKEILQRRIVTLEKEHDELMDVLNVAERLFKSIRD